MTTDAAAFTTSQTRDARVDEVRFINTLASEWSKLTSLRSTYIVLGLGFVLSILATGLGTFAVGETFDGWSEAQQATFEPIAFAMLGNVIALIVATVFGVLAVSSEYSNGMIQLSMIATPRRARVLWAKVLLVFGVTLGFGLATVAGMFLVGQAVLGAAGLPTATLGDSDALRFVVGLGAATPLFPIIGLALGVILRSTAGAITAALGILWLPLVFNNMLPLSVQEHVLSRLPGAAIDSVTISHVVQSTTDSPLMVGIALVVAWLVGFVGIAQVLLQRRDA